MKILRITIKSSLFLSLSVANWLILLLITSSMASCLPTVKGAYQITKSQKSTANPVVFVDFKDMKSQEISNCAVKVNGGNVYHTEGKNNVSFTLTEGKYYFQGYSVGYEILRTKRIKISKGDSLFLPMILKPYRGGFPD